MDKLIEWSGSLIGASGAMILALDLSFKFEAFAAFFAANLLVGFFTYRKGLYGLLTQQLFFVPSSIIGMITFY